MTQYPEKICTLTSPVFIITGEQGAGKTTLLLDVLKLIPDDIRIRGFVAPGSVNNGVRTGFTLLDPATGRCEELCSSVASPGSERYGRFYFRPEGLSFGRRLIHDAMQEAIDLLIIDEVGRFEMEGQVWAACIDEVARPPHPPMIWTVRRSLTDAVITRWNLQRPVIIEPGMTSPALFVEDLIREVRIWRASQP